MKCGPFIIVQATGIPLPCRPLLRISPRYVAPHSLPTSNHHRACFEGFQVQPLNFFLTIPRWRSKVSQITHIKIHDGRSSPITKGGGE